ncbi:MAG: hypothetical protein FJ161_04935, partial [Gammaproteobacteria bacterium]|nr:hypothetical protein [Gammaproteobacteria bacterium]
MPFPFIMLETLFRKILFPYARPSEQRDMTFESFPQGQGEHHEAIEQQIRALEAYYAFKNQDDYPSGFVALLRTHEDNQARAGLQNANNALIYGGLSPEEEHRIAQRDLRRAGWTE